MNIADCAEFVARMEGIKLKAYDMEGDIAGVDTIGVGHLLTSQERSGGIISIDGKWVAYKDGITREQAIKLLSQDLVRFVRCVEHSVSVPLTNNQEIALVSFCFNIGCGAFLRSTLLRRINAGEYESVPGELGRWTKNNGIVVQGLKNRRDSETKLWLT